VGCLWQTLLLFWYLCLSQEAQVNCFMQNNPFLLAGDCLGTMICDGKSAENIWEGILRALK
jgi:hypothetical protein